MATVVGIKISERKERVGPLISDEKFTGPEPKWDTERASKMEDDEFEHHLRKSLNYYNYYFSQKDSWKHVAKWLQSHAKLPAEELKTFLRADPKTFPMTACSLILAVNAGMPLKEKHKEFVLTHVKRIVGANATDDDVETVSTAKSVVAPTIQDRLAEKTSAVIADIEGEIDSIYLGGVSEMKFFDFLTTKNVPQAQVGKIRKVFQRQLDEISLAIAGTDEQLKEGYSHVLKDKKKLKKITDFYAKLMSDLDSYTHVKKVTKKVRTKKMPTKEKMVSKVKIMKEDKTLKIVSVNPADIIGAKAVWVYNAKYRKIGRYEAEEHQTLGIKGTTIINFNETKSVAKTLRQPAEQLKAFMKCGKVALRSFLKDIRAVETKMNGRLSEDILILKVE